MPQRTQPGELIYGMFILLIDLKYMREGRRQLIPEEVLYGRGAGQLRMNIKIFKYPGVSGNGSQFFELLIYPIQVVKIIQNGAFKRGFKNLNKVGV